MAIVGFIDDKYQLNTGGKISLQSSSNFLFNCHRKYKSLTQLGDYYESISIKIK